MDFAITLDSNSLLPLHQQIYEELRQAILSGRLSPGEGIPSTRSLAKSLGISRTTITQSYDQLLSEGYLETIVGSGTFVCNQLPDDLLRSTPIDPTEIMTRPPVKLSKYGASLIEAESLPRIVEPELPINFRYGRPAFDQFPMKLFPALQGLDKSDSVLYIGTFSKVLFPSLRIGYLVLPKSLILPFARAKWLSDRHLPLLEQQVLTDFIESGHLERHMRKMRAIYDRRRQVLVKALNMHFGKHATILGEKAGIHLMVRFQTHLSDEEIIQGAALLGVGIMSAGPQYLRPHPTGEFIFGYGELTEQQLEEGVYRLAQIIIV